MQNTKVVRIIKSLNQFEIRQFKEYVHSPFFNKNKNVTKLFDELKKFYPKFSDDKMIEENIFAKVFPGEKFDYFKFKNLVSDLFKLCRDFLSYIRYKKNSHLRDMHLLEELRNRNLDNIFEQTFRASQKQNEESLVKDELYINRKLDLLSEEISFNVPKKPNENIDLQQMKLDLFTDYALIRFLKYYDIMLHEQKQNTYKYKMNMFDEVMNYLGKNMPENNPVMNIYYNIILLEKKREDIYFHKLKTLRQKHYNELSEYDRYMTFLHMTGFCAQIYNIDARTDFMREHFELVKDKKTIYETENPGKILYPDFINEVKIAIRVDEIEWAENYILRNESSLQEEKDSTLNFCYGMINYKKGDHDIALDHLSKTYFPNFIIKLQVKILQLQIYFEKRYFEQALSMIDAFRHYLKRESTIKDDFKEAFYEYLRLVNELIKISSGHYQNNTAFQTDKLRADIKNMKTNLFGIKLWLGDKTGINVQGDTWREERVS